MRRLVFVLLVCCQKRTFTTVVGHSVDADTTAAVVAEMNAMKPATGEIELPAVLCKADATAPKKHTAPLTKALAALASPEKVLALYYGDHGAVLGPAGFHCDTVSGPGGAATWVLPPNVTSRDEMKGEAIVFHEHLGGTSGRRKVIAVGASVFPSMGSMAQNVAKEFPDVKPQMPYAPIAGETVWLGTTLVRFVDDPNVEGLGMRDAHFIASATPIQGSFRAIPKGDVFDLHTITMRLEGAHAALIPIVQADFEDRSMRPSSL